jgi:hypothetical protein
MSRKNPSGDLLFPEFHFFMLGTNHACGRYPLAPSRRAPRRLRRSYPIESAFEMRFGV